MSPLHLKENQSAKITKINANKVLKYRFNSFGIIEGTFLKLCSTTLFKNTFEIQVGNSRIALRAEELNKIEVERIN